MTQDYMANTRPEHHFEVADALKHGVEKAVLLYNIKFWLDRNRANDTHIKEKDGKSYYWTFNSASSYAVLFPYLPFKSISRWLLELEQDGALISGVFNENKYDKTKWYSTPDHEKTLINSIPQNEQSMAQNEQPIPDINTDIKPLSTSPKGEDADNSLEPIWEELDHDGDAPIRRKTTSKQPRNKEALAICRYFVELGKRNGYNFATNTEDYYRICKVLRDEGLSIADVRSVLEEGVETGKIEKQGYTLKGLLSVSNINKWRN